MDLHFVGTANVFVYYPYLRKAMFVLAHYADGSKERQVDGIFTVQLSYHRIAMLLLLRN